MRWFNLFLPMVILLACGVARAQMPTYRMGTTPNADEVRAWDIDYIGPTGKELPAGSGTATEGAKVYAQKCAVCHGPTAAEGGPRYSGKAPRLVGGKGTITDWEFATSIWAYINRAMPPDKWDVASLTSPALITYINSAMPSVKKGPLSADDLYALTAFLLYRNGIIKESDVMDAKTLPKVQMPNRHGSASP